MASESKSTARMSGSARIVLYEETDLRGKKEQFRQNVDDLGTHMFSDRARSLKVEGDHWVAYTEKSYKGEFMVYGDGDHVTLDNMDQKIQSLRLVTEDLQDPNIVLYEDIHYGGADRSIEEAVPNLKYAGFDKLVSSHEVKQGVWILYEDADFLGRRVITFVPDKWVDYRSRCLNDKISSLKPLKSTDFKV